MKIRRCDRCGKIMENMREGYEFNIDCLNGRNAFYEGNPIIYDLCGDCYMKFNKFMIDGIGNESEETE